MEYLSNFKADNKLVVVQLPARTLNKLLLADRDRKKDFVDKFNLVFLVNKTLWSKNNAIALKVKVNGKNVTAILDTGSSGIFISEHFFKQISIKEDKEVKFAILLATQNSKKKRKLIFNLKVELGKTNVLISALVLEGLNFDVLLGMSWINKVGASINPSSRKIRIDH